MFFKMFPGDSNRQPQPSKQKSQYAGLQIRVDLTQILIQLSWKKPDPDPNLKENRIRFSKNNPDPVSDPFLTLQKKNLYVQHGSGSDVVLKTGSGSAILIWSTEKRRNLFNIHECFFSPNKDYNFLSKMKNN